MTEPTQSETPTSDLKYGDYFPSGERERLLTENQRLREEVEALKHERNSAGMKVRSELLPKLDQLKTCAIKLAEIARTIGWTSAEDPKTLRMAEAALAEFDKLNTP